MRGWVLVVAAAGCSFPGNTPPAGTDGGDGPGMTDAPPRPDAMPGTELWRLESDPDFGLGLPENMAVARGGIEPFAYAYGPLRMRGANTQEFLDPAPASLWTDLETTTTQSGFALASPSSWADLRPGGVGLDSNGSWTIWGDGEMYLEQGGHSFTYNADDAGQLAVDHARDGSWGFRISATYLGGTTGALAVGTTGWYPVRIAQSQGTGDAYFVLLDDPPGGLPNGTVYPGRYRSRINDLAGLYQIAFDERYMGKMVGSDLYDASAIDEDWGNGTPPDLALSDGDGFTLRWVGQLWVDTAGTYEFSASTDDGYRLWIDGVPELVEYTAQGTQSGTTAPLALAPGWHDLVFDMIDGVGMSRAQLLVSIDGATPTTLPATRFRPATPRGERITTATRGRLGAYENEWDFDVNLGMVITTGGAPVTATAIEGAFTAVHTDWADVRVVVAPPGDPAQAVFDVGADSSPDNQTHEISLSPSGVSMHGQWIFGFSDTSAGAPSSANAEMMALTIHHTGGEPTIAPTATWTSEVHAFSRSVTIQNVMYSAIVPTGSTIAVDVRACTMADCGDDPPWRDIPSSGANPGAPAAPYAQLRVRFTSDGDASPWLDWIDVNAVQ
jgi:hypothetical protein